VGSLPSAREIDLNQRKFKAVVAAFLNRQPSSTDPLHLAFSSRAHLCPMISTPCVPPVARSLCVCSP
jgi:hypothetical protein